MARVAAITSWAARGSNGYGLAIAAVGAALLARLGLEAFGKFYYLPLIPAVMLPALLASRRATALAIALAIAANVFLVSRESVADAVINALLFALVGAAIGEIGRARRSLKARSIELNTQLNTRNATIHAMLASAPVVTLDAGSIILAISQPACALFRTTESAATGRPFQEFVEFFDAGIVRASPPGEPTTDQYWLGRRADGDVFPLGIQLAFVTGDPGTSEVILTLTDLSLWHSAELRSQELSDQLNHVWRMNSLGEMAAILSHELNQPLTAAASYLQASQADLGRAGILADSASRTVELAKSQVLRAGAIIRRARELLTVEVHPLEPERMSSMIDDLGPIIQWLGPASDAGIQITIDSVDDRVMADRIQFQQAIVNLVRNAVEAVADLDRREVRLIGRPVGPDFYEIRVEDSGPGVPPDQVERMFEPLMTTKSDGMGLGLSVTRTIVENHGAALTVGRSDMGGAAFMFSLHRAKEDPVP
jgi:two-component system sensor kinase FixL